MLLTGYQTPTGMRRMATSRLTAWLKNRKVRNSAAVAATAMAAAESQHTAVPGEKLSAATVVRLAKEVMTLDEEIAEIDALVESRLREHRHAKAILSLPGMGPLLSAEFIAITGGDMSAFGTCDRLAGVAGLAPPPYHATRDASPATFTGHAATTGGSCGSSTSPPRSQRAAAPSPRSSTTANAARARGTSRPSSPSPGAASTLCGPSYETTGPSNSTHPEAIPQRHDRYERQRAKRITPGALPSGSRSISVSTVNPASRSQALTWAGRRRWT